MGRAFSSRSRYKGPRPGPLQITFMARDGLITRPVRYIISGVLTLLLLAVSVFGLVMGYGAVGKPFPGFTVLPNNVVSIIWLPEWDGFQRGIKFGDAIVAVDGVRVGKGVDLNEEIAGKRPGQEVTYSILRGGEKIELTIPVSLFTLRYYVLIFPFFIFFGLVFFGLGVAVFLMKPDLASSRAFLFFCTLAGLTLAANPEYCVTHVFMLPMFTVIMSGPSLLLFGLYFPRKHGRLKTIALIAWSITAAILALNAIFFRVPRVFIVFDTLMVINNLLCCVTAIAIIVRDFMATDDPVVRQRAKVVLFSIGVSFTGVAAVLVGTNFLRVITIYWAFIPLTFFPLSMAYAIVKHNLFDADVFIVRSSSYLAVSALVMFISLLLISGFSLALRDISGFSSEIAALGTIFIMVVVFRPLRDHVDLAIERRFFRDKYEYQRAISEAGKILGSYIELDELLGKMLDTVMDAIKIARGFILLREREGGQFKLYALRDRSGGVPDDPDPTYYRSLDYEIEGIEHPLFRRLEIEGRAIQMNDIEEMPESDPDRLPMLRLMHELEIVAVIPVLFQEELIGILGLGPKMTGAWYSSGDEEILEALMTQTAVSIENAKKVEELKRMVQIETSYHELKKLDEMKDNFLSMVSHDLRTPMTGIVAYAQIIRSGLDDLGKEEQAKYLDVIIKQSKRLTRLINNLLDIQRLEAGKMTMASDPVDLKAVIRDAREAFRALAREKDVALRRETAEEDAVVIGDRDRLDQVLVNLLSNAMKFTPPGGEVTVSLALERGDRPLARVTVADTGPGVAEELRERLFDKFQQGDKLMRDKEQGSGLGLALVRQIVERHGGEVGVKSEPGRGSEFYFTLPLPGGNISEAGEVENVEENIGG